MLLSSLAPTPFHNAEIMINSMRAAGLNPKQCVEACVAVIFLQSKANGISDEDTMKMFAQTYAQFLKAHPVLPTITVKS